ncbi:MAG: AGE family epimerase/isomerase [Phycisphaerae bacterium]|nr:AGE family epimerase/isomerase [Phycisphaerae bacterium]
MELTSKLDLTEMERLIVVYRDGLLKDTLPFWMDHCVDREYGGFNFALDRDGTVLSTDKYLWLHGRFVWLLSELFLQVEPNGEWLELAEHGMAYILRHGFADNGKMYFSVDQQGRPLRMRRYVFSETFAVMAMASLSRAKKDAALANRALALFKQIIEYFTTPGMIEPKFDSRTRPMKGLSTPMIIISTAQVLREAVDDPFCQVWIDRSIAEIQNNFMHHGYEAVMETTGPAGELIDTMEGRTLTPGHAIEAAWFVLHEAKLRDNDAELRQTGLTMLDWMWDRGWDKEYGGILYYTDVKGLSCSEYWHDMKFWWPHNETIIASLLAHVLTGDDKYLNMFRKVHDWTYAHFPDPDYGEWFGYLHRDGSVSSRLKGNQWKGAFHLPRMQLYCWKLLEEARQAGSL